MLIMLININFIIIILMRRGIPTWIGWSCINGMSCNWSVWWYRPSPITITHHHRSPLSSPSSPIIITYHHHHHLSSPITTNHCYSLRSDGSICSVTVDHRVDQLWGWFLWLEVVVFIIVFLMTRYVRPNLMPIWMLALAVLLSVLVDSGGITNFSHT